VHNFAVLITKGPPYNATILLRDINTQDPHAPDAHPPFRGGTLSAIQLEARSWTEARVYGFVKGTPALQGADTVWLVAHSPRGRKYRWEVARLRALQALADSGGV
jgi:hypothetical protein